MNLGVTHNWGHFQWLLYFWTTVFKTTFYNYLNNSNCSSLQCSRVVYSSPKFCSSNWSVSTVLSARNFSTIATPESSSSNSKISPEFLSGFADGEGCFSVSLVKVPKLKVGYQVQQRFELALHVRDKPLLEDVKFCLGGGKIFLLGPNAVQLKVSSKEEIQKLIELFEKYPLVTKKASDFILFKQIYYIKKSGQHLTKEGLHKIVDIKASMNWGLFEKLKAAFPDVVPVVRPLVETPKTIDPDWLAGFTSAEGCFIIKIRADNRQSLGFQVRLVFYLTQHSRDVKLLVCINSYLKCGHVYKKRDTFNFEV